VPAGECLDEARIREAADLLEAIPLAADRGVGFRHICDGAGTERAGILGAIALEHVHAGGLGRGAVPPRPRALQCHARIGLARGGRVAVFLVVVAAEREHDRHLQTLASRALWFHHARHDRIDDGIAEELEVLCEDRSFRRADAVTQRGGDVGLVRALAGHHGDRARSVGSLRGRGVASATCAAVATKIFSLVAVRVRNCVFHSSSTSIADGPPVTRVSCPSAAAAAASAGGSRYR
jgi:hypothetical protein